MKTTQSKIILAVILVCVIAGGAINTTDLVLTQNTYSNAEQNYIQAKYLGILYAQLLQFYQGNEIKL